MTQKPIDVGALSRRARAYVEAYSQQFNVTDSDTWWAVFSQHLAYLLNNDLNGTPVEELTKSRARQLAIILAAQNMGCETIVNDAERLGDIPANVIGGIIDAGHSERWAENAFEAEVDGFQTQLLEYGVVPEFWSDALDQLERLEPRSDPDRDMVSSERVQMLVLWVWPQGVGVPSVRLCPVRDMQQGLQQTSFGREILARVQETPKGLLNVAVVELTYEEASYVRRGKATIVFEGGRYVFRKG